MSYCQTFTLRSSYEADIESVLSEYSRFPVAADMGGYTLRNMPDGGWAFLMPTTQASAGTVLEASADYGEMTLHIAKWQCRNGKDRIILYNPSVLPVSSIIRNCCEAGIELHGGVPIHTSLVGKEGEGILFLGPSGMGKSTQAKLWQTHLEADFICGDRACLRLLDGRWQAFGMPWDGKDAMRHQRSVPVKAFVVLEQAPENRIRRMTALEAKIALFHQVVIPAWDQNALDSVMPQLSRLSSEIPFYHLGCRPDAEAVRLTYEKLFGRN